MNYIGSAVAVLLMALAISAPGSATPFTNQATFQAAAGGGVLVETFEGFNSGDQVGSLPGLGITFGTLSTGLFPLVINGLPIGGTVASGTKVLINNNNASLPADGPIVIFANAGTLITALGYFNTSVDDTTRLSFFDLDDVLIETAVSGNGSTPVPFLGIVGAVGAARVQIESTGNANNFISIDDLQIVTAVNGVPEPGALALFGIGLVGLGVIRRRRKAA